MADPMVIILIAAAISAAEGIYTGEGGIGWFVVVINSVLSNP